MPRAKLRIRPPERVWIAAVSRAYPDAQFRVLAALPTKGAGVGLLRITADELPAVLAAMEDHDGVSDLAVLEASEDEALVQFETVQPLLLLSLREAGVPLVTPVEIQDGTVTMTVAGSTDRLSTLATQFESTGIPFEVAAIYPDIDVSSLLTDRQRELVVAAVERGFYDTPRRCTLTGLAEDLGIAKSTASETLHRAEGRIVASYVENLEAGGHIE